MCDFRSQIMDIQGTDDRPRQTEFDNNWNNGGTGTSNTAN